MAANRERKAVFPGSFDPLTNGHVDLVRRALACQFDEITIAVLSNPTKQSLFTVEERMAHIREEFGDCGSAVRVETFQGLLVDFLRRAGIYIVIRGLRAVSDYDYETQMALINRNLCERVETFFLVAREEYSFISSTIVKQVASLGGSVEQFVPPAVARALGEKMKKRG